MNFDFSTWDKTDWAIGGLVAFALLMGFSAMQSAGSRLRTTRMWK